MMTNIRKISNNLDKTQNKFKKIKKNIDIVQETWYIVIVGYR